MQQNSKCRLFDDKDGTINHIISEYSKLAQKEYGSSHDKLEKVIFYELCKKLKFDHSTEWYMYKLESVLENETYKVLCDFERQTDHLIPTKRPDLMIISKKQKPCSKVDFAVSENNIVKIKENKK